MVPDRLYCHQRRKAHDSNIRRKVVRAHIQDGSTIASLVAEYGISRATVSNWVRSYREECQNNDEEKSKLGMMEELRRLRREKAELEKENSFLKSCGILHEGDQIWFVVSFLSVVSQRHSTRGLQTISSLYDFQFAQLIIPYLFCPLSHRKASKQVRRTIREYGPVDSLCSSWRKNTSKIQ